jgi:GAF domain-containing protein
MTHETDSLHDHDRLAEIAELDLTNTEIDTVLQDVVKEAAASLNLPQAMVSGVLDEAQYFAAMHGVEGWMAATRGTPLEWSFCQHTARRKEIFVVEDATADELVKDSPLVRLEGQRCYAGVPMISSRGHVLGSFCVAGPDAHSFSPEELNELRRLAAKATARLEERRPAA